jgi:hypothetical protein
MEVPALPPFEGPLSAEDLGRLGAVARRLPIAWTATPRRRRLLFLGIAAPGFLAVFATPLHQSLGVLLAGFGLFGGACVFRRRTERVFARAEAVALWPPIAATPIKEDAHRA